jgi:hypothetical protein
VKNNCTLAHWDIKGKRLLEIHEKYLLGEIGLRHALLGYREGDISRLLENVVFLELKRRGYKVFIGKLNSHEVHLMAEKENEKSYIQVTYLLSSKEAVEREFSVLQVIPDNSRNISLAWTPFLVRIMKGSSD